MTSWSFGIAVWASLAGCSPSPEQAAARAWSDDLAPVLAENGLVWQRVLETAADVHDGRADTDAAYATWKRDIVPLTEHVRDQAALVQAPNAWVLDHATLVEVWSVRAGAYRDLSVALDQGDTERWRNARARADKAKLDEEAWFQATNEKLRPYGLTLDQYAPPATLASHP